MRIAFITNLFPPIQTGSSYWVLEAVRALSARGHQVIVITCGPGLKEESVEALGPARVYRLPPTFHFPRLRLFLNFDQFYLMANRRNWRRTREILNQEGIEMIHQTGHLLDSVLLSVQARRTLGIPAVCSIHTRIGHPTSAIYDMVLRGIDRFFLGPAIMRKFDRLVALDDVLVRHYQSLYSVAEIDCVPVCVEDQILDTPVAHPAAGPPVRIASVGHVTDMRDRRHLLLAIAELKKKGLPVRLDIAGKVLTDVTQRIIDELDLQDTVRLLGELPRMALLQLLRESSLETHWIDIQGIGSAAIEAMALGLPVAAWAYEGIYGEVPLRHLESMVFIDPNDHGALVHTLEMLILDPELRGRIGSKGREVVRQHLTWSSVAARMEQVYDRVIAQKEKHGAAVLARKA